MVDKLRESEINTIDNLFRAFNFINVLSKNPRMYTLSYPYVTYPLQNDTLSDLNHFSYPLDNIEELRKMTLADRYLKAWRALVYSYTLPGIDGKQKLHNIARDLYLVAEPIEYKDNTFTIAFYPNDIDKFINNVLLVVADLYDKADLSNDTNRANLALKIHKIISDIFVESLYKFIDKTQEDDFSENSEYIDKINKIIQILPWLDSVYAHLIYNLFYIYEFDLNTVRKILYTVAEIDKFSHLHHISFAGYSLSIFEDESLSHFANVMYAGAARWLISSGEKDFLSELNFFKENIFYLLHSENQVLNCTIWRYAAKQLSSTYFTLDEFLYGSAFDEDEGSSQFIQKHKQKIRTKKHILEDKIAYYSSFINLDLKKIDSILY